MPSFSAPQKVYNYNKVVSQRMLNAVKEGKLIVPQYIQEHIKQIAKQGHFKYNGKRAYFSVPLLNMLNALVTSKTLTKNKPMSILSLFRVSSKNHAYPTQDEIICKAVDIDYYLGYKIHIEKPESALNGIVSIINRMPLGRYHIGLPRPGGGALINPKKDYFLPVTDLKQNQASPTGSTIGDLKLIKNPKAREKLTEAIRKNQKAKILYLLPDATDHVHIKAID